MILLISLKAGHRAITIKTDKLDLKLDKTFHTPTPFLKTTILEELKQLMIFNKAKFNY